MPKPDELIFGFKTFSGAMAALYLSLWLGLDNPYWAMATAFIVAHPFAGAMRSKALYRFFGTVLGGCAAVALVPNLVNAPELLSLALALWIGLCLYLSLLDRSPRAYTFMLAGYTAGIIGFPAVNDPGHIFQTALTRVEEISLGIGCTTMFGTLIYPRPLGPMLARRIASWVKPAADWSAAALAGEGESPLAREARRRLAFEATDAAVMITQLAYDTSHLQAAVRHVTRLRLYVISLMPVLSSIGERVAQLRQMDALTPSLRTTLHATAAWVATGKADGAADVLAQIKALEDNAHDWAGLLRASLAVRLEELVNIAQHSRKLRQHVVEGDPAPDNPRLEAEYIAVTAHNRDHKLALLSAMAAALAVITVCAIWIATAWQAGAGAAIMVAIACSFFAAQDDPAPAIARMLRNAAIIILADAGLIFAILPRVDSFSALYLVLLPFGLLIGVLVSRPATFGTGMVLGAVGTTQLALENGYRGDFVVYANNSLGLILGLGAALVITRLIRSVGAAWSTERLLRANWAEVAAAAQASGAHDRARLTGIMMDRLGLMMPRLAAVASGADEAAATVMRDLRVGLNVVALQREQWRLPAPARQASTRLLTAIATCYRDDPRHAPPETLRDAIDETIRTLLHAPHTYRAALMMLSGLRSVLFPAAPPPALFTAPTIMQAST